MLALLLFAITALAVPGPLLERIIEHALFLKARQKRNICHAQIAPQQKASHPDFDAAVKAMIRIGKPFTPIASYQVVYNALYRSVYHICMAGCSRCIRRSSKSLAIKICDSPRRH